MGNQISIIIFPDSHEAEAHGFNYNEWDIKPTPVTATRAVIVKNGTEGGRASVDFIIEDKAGNKSVFMITARLLGQIVKAAT